MIRFREIIFPRVNNGFKIPLIEYFLALYYLIYLQLITFIFTGSQFMICFLK